jgi:hypothetical protein
MLRDWVWFVYNFVLKPLELRSVKLPCFRAIDSSSICGRKILRLGSLAGAAATTASTELCQLPPPSPYLTSSDSRDSRFSHNRFSNKLKQTRSPVFPIIGRRDAMRLRRAARRARLHRLRQVIRSCSQHLAARPFPLQLCAACHSCVLAVDVAMASSLGSFARPVTSWLQISVLAPRTPPLACHWFLVLPGSRCSRPGPGRHRPLMWASCLPCPRRHLFLHWIMRSPYPH